MMIQGHFTWVLKLFIHLGKGRRQGFPLLAVIWGVDFSPPEKDYQSLALPEPNVERQTAAQWDNHCQIGVLNLGGCHIAFGH